MTQPKEKLSRRTALMIALSSVLAGEPPAPEDVEKLTGPLTKAAQEELAEITQKMKDVLSAQKTEITESIVNFMTTIARVYKAAIPFHLEIEKSLREITGGVKTSIHDPDLEDELLNLAMEHAIRRIFNDPEMNVDSVSVPDILERIEKNKADSAKKTVAVIAPRTLMPFDKVTETFLKHGKPPTSKKQSIKVRTFNGTPAEKGKKAISPAFVTLTYELNDSSSLIDIGGYELVKGGKLDYKDFKILVAMNSVYEEKKQRCLPALMSPREILKNATNSKTRPTKTQIADVLARIVKMMGTVVRIDATNEQHLERHARKMITGPFLPCMIIEENGYINSTPSILIEVLTEPPFFTFAKDKRQFSTFDSRIFNKSPLSFTDENARIECYLIKRIAGMKHSRNVARSILFETLFAECAQHEADSTQPLLKSRQAEWTHKKRIKTNALKFLQHLKDEHYIKNFAEDDDKFKITL